MRLVSWTLAGPGTAPIIGDALRSVARIVDGCIVIWTGPREDAPDGGEAWETNDVCADAVRATNRVWLNWRSWAWRDDYGAARNHGLACAGEESADFSCMVDTDETIICPNPAAVRAWLAALPPEVDIVLVMHNDGSHSRERFFRMPCRHRFVGRTHEMIEGTKVLAPRALIEWSELPKTPEQLRAKWERDVEMLRADLADDPSNGAVEYYLAESLQSLGRHEEAIQHFREHNRLSAWEEARAWSCFKAAESYHALGQPYRVLECAAQGLVHDAGMAELYWIAATACWVEAAKIVEVKGDARKAWDWVEQARCWGEVARVHGAGSKAEARRVGKRDVRGLGQGVDEVLRMVEEVSEQNGTPNLETAWDRVFTAFDLHGKPRNESLLGTARDGHPNALAIVRNELADAECPSCGPLEECPGATPEAFEKREALRALFKAMGGSKPGPREDLA